MIDNAQTLKLEEVLAAAKSSQKGLSHDEAGLRLKQYGKNTLQERKTSKFVLFLRQFNSLLVYILFVASALSLWLGDLKDFFVIFGLVVFNGVLGFWQEVKAEASIEALKKMTEHKVRVLRDGKLQELPSSELVPGDVMVLSDGDMVSADARLIESAGLLVDESSITGESLPVAKDKTAVLKEEIKPYELENMVLTGTAVVKGSGKAVVVKTGSQTYFASIANKVKEKSPPTPVTKAIQSFSRKYVFLVIGLLLAVGGIDIAKRAKPAETVYVLIAQLVSAVPEGLPLVITLVMVIGAIALSRKKTLTRHLPAVETLGSATVIASDKTGTITEGKLTVQEFFVLDEKMLRIAACLSNDSENGLGDPVDVSLAVWCGKEYEEIRKRHARFFSYPFDSSRKLMASGNEFEGKRMIFVKGALESFKAIAANTGEFSTLEAKMGQMAENGLRVLAFGAGDFLNENPEQWKVNIVGLVGFLDPPKQGVKEAVETAQKAGIRVMMITGDFSLTAKAIARQVGIYKEKDAVLTGDDIDKMGDKQLFDALGRATVLARALPEQKYRIVKLLQSKGEIVAVTGDGVNDVPVLKIADLGIAMGSGSEAAKSVAKMVIADNNLKVIIDAIKNGRVIASNLRKVIYYLISTNIMELILVSSCIILGMPLPLLAIQILWVNLVTDGVQDKVFPFIKEEGDVMRHRPRKPEKQFFDFIQISRIMFFAALMGIAHIILFAHLIRTYPYAIANSIIFTSVVATQFFNGVQAQKERMPFFYNLAESIRINPLIYASCAAGALLQLVALYIVPEWFGAAPLSMEHWKYIAVMCGLSFMLVELKKWIELFWGKRVSA
jgi:P-type Ca2+ transporter type 2C